MTDPHTRSRLQAAAGAASTDDSEAIYRQLLGADPENPHALFHLGALLVGRGSMAEGQGLLMQSSRMQVKAYEATPDLTDVVALTRFLEAEAFPGSSPLTYWAYVTAKFASYGMKDEVDVCVWIYVIKLALMRMPTFFNARMGEVSVEEYLALNLSRLYMVLKDWGHVEHYARLSYQDSPTAQQCLAEALLEQGKLAPEIQGMLTLATLELPARSCYPHLGLPEMVVEQYAPPVRGRVLFISSDAGYLEKFSIAQALSAIEHDPALTVHFHVINPTDRTHALIERVRAIHPGVALSTERVDFEALGYDPTVDRAFYYCNIRFLRLAQLRRLYPEAVICATDSDTLFIGGLDEVVEEPGTYGVILDKLPEEQQGLVLLGHRIGAALILVAPNTAGQAYVDTLADFIGANMRRSVFWFLDQIALYCVTKRLSAHGGYGIRFFDTDAMNRCFVNGHYHGKFEDNLYSRRRAEVLGRHGFDPDLGQARGQADANKEQYKKTITGVRWLNRRAGS
ncbi:hypothetical protein [Azospirillum agricola]|uniref:hypothetical protein n=1 Tax=Azospirillum agricola TaxID=1720247 RepID=UPI000A0F1E9D|nr:hypothetical protein [Azospirillum agricola]SMH41328.1 hypothetical protein SAMN02982994_1705 [Azospirillum lipoferum]